MKQAYRVFPFLLVLMIASCTSAPHPVGMLARQPKDERGAKLVFERDGAQEATACPALIYVNGTLRARVGASEAATIPVMAGYTNVRVKLGKFCGTIRDMIVTLNAAPGAEYRWRIGIGN